ncbi:MAG: GDP-L-fucose synthase [Nitrosotalea sp.]
MDWTDKKIVVTGGSGFLGSRVVDALQKRGARNIFIPRSKDCDLRLQDNCAIITKNADIVFHLAAKVGGIGLNQQKPGELFYDNLVMGVNLMEEARKNRVTKFVALGTICSYPKFTPVPFLEESIWNGYPEETNAPYGLAKKMLLVQSQAYRQQYDFRSIVVFPTNLYGPNDNFEENKSHVIPALIKKIYLAKKENASSINLWGDGSPTRDFLYVDDAAEGIVLAAEKYDKTDPVNLGTGEEISIKYLAEMLLKLMNANLSITWQTDKPNGQPRRCVDSKRALQEFGFKPKISFEEGLKRTIAWFEKTQSG